MKNPPEGYHTITPQAVVPDARETIEFVKLVFDAEVGSIWEQDGTVRHAEAMIGDSKLMLATANEEFSAFPMMLNLYVEDVDAVYARAVEHGATSMREPANQFYGDRTAGVLDRQGNQWWISTHIEDVSDEEMARRMAEMEG